MANSNAYLQAERPLRIETILGPDVLLLFGMVGEEGLSRLFHYNLDVLADNHVKVPMEQLLGQRLIVSLGLPEGRYRHFSGICSRVSRGHTDNTFTRYRLEMVPQVWFLTRKANCRIFQHQNVPDILAEVLKGLDVKFELNGDYQPRDYCVQYRETDFDFISRLMEEEGIFYDFIHSENGHTMMIADTPGVHPEMPKPSLLKYHQTEDSHAMESRVTSWEESQELRPGKWTLRDHCFERPKDPFEVQEAIRGEVEVGDASRSIKIRNNDKLEIYDYPGAFAQRFDGVDAGGGDRAGDINKIRPDGEHTVGIRMEQDAVRTLEIRGKSLYRNLTAGHLFELAGQGHADGNYLMTWVRHEAKFESEYRSTDGGGGEFLYGNTFTCIPAELPYRPQRVTPKPVVHGSQTAVVVGPAGYEIFTDKYGRIKVQFPWDRIGRRDSSSSCWIRVAQLAAGNRWGASFWPRVGQEVVVAFLEGDPDQPLVVGSVYNADQMPPYLGQGPDSKHAEDNKVSGIKTNSTKGGQGYNELRFDDTAKKEQLFLHAQRNMDVRVRSNSMENVGGSRHLHVGWEKDGQKGGDQKEEVLKDKHLHVHNNQNEWVGGDLVLRIGGGDGDGHQEVDVAGNRVEHVTKNCDLTVDKDRRTLIQGKDSLKVTKDYQQKVGMKMGVEAGMEIHLKAGMKLILEAGAQLSLKAGAGFIDIGPTGVAISGPTVLINSGGAAGAGSGAKPDDPETPRQAEPAKPTPADNAVTGHSSADGYGPM